MKKKMQEKATPKNPPASTVQTARGKSQPFTVLESYVPLATAEQTMYDALREAVPVIDAALDKIVRLIGSFKISCGDKGAEAALESFLKEVKVGYCGAGINTFIGTYLDRLLTWGTVIAEIVPYSSGEIAALYCADNKNIELLTDGNPINVKVCVRQGGNAVPLPYQERILLSALNPMPGEARGTSILRGLPFVSSILLKIFNSIGTNWERVGNLRYAVTYKPGGSVVENTLSADAVSEISDEWSRAMSSENGVKDFVAVGDVDIKVIGADNQILDSEVPVRQLLEQIIAKLGIPPFMLGLSWSTTERMSQQQADILTSELESYRSLINPIIRRICRWQLNALGYSCDFEINWDDINLQDEVEASKAALMRAQAKRKD